MRHLVAERCKSHNEEPEHWIKVCGLHTTTYFPPPGSNTPFVIPDPPPKPIQPPPTSRTVGTPSTPTQSAKENKHVSAAKSDAWTPSKLSIANSSPCSVASSVVGSQVFYLAVHIRPRKTSDRLLFYYVSHPLA